MQNEILEQVEAYAALIPMIGQMKPVVDQVVGQLKLYAPLIEEFSNYIDNKEAESTAKIFNIHYENLAAKGLDPEASARIAQNLAMADKQRISENFRSIGASRKENK